MWYTGTSVFALRCRIYGKRNAEAIGIVWKRAAASKTTRILHYLFEEETKKWDKYQIKPAGSLMLEQLTGTTVPDEISFSIISSYLTASSCIDGSTSRRLRLWNERLLGFCCLELRGSLCVGVSRLGIHNQ